MTLDPHDPGYLDEAAVRHALADALSRFAEEASHESPDSIRAVLPTLFALLDRYGGDGGRFTPAEQDVVVDECFPARWCMARSQIPPAGGVEVEFPEVLLRVNAMRLARGYVSRRTRATVRLVEHDDGAISARGLGRLMGASADLSKTRPRPSLAPERFSDWFGRRPDRSSHRRHASVTVLATGPIDRFAPDIGRAAVSVLRHHGVSCTLSPVRNSGAALLEAGAVARFARVAERNVAALVGDVRDGRTVVILDPAAAHVLRHAYPTHVSAAARTEADAVATNACGLTEYLTGLHGSGVISLDTGFDAGRASVDGGVVLHRNPFEQLHGGDDAARALLTASGVDVTSVDGCAGVDTMWGLRAVYDDTVERLGSRLASDLDRHADRTVSSTSRFASAVIEQHTGRAARHPIGIVAAGYGVAGDSIE